MKINRDGYGPDGRRIYFKGGGGGGGQTERDATPEERALWATQERIARETFNMGGPKYQQSIDALGGMAKESMDGTLATRARGIAGADAAAATGAGLSAATRSLDRYGATVNPNAMAATAVNAGLAGASIKSNAMNSAGAWAEDQKWNRNQNLFNSVQGLPGQTTNSLANLSQQIGNDRRASNESYQTAMGGIGQGAAYLTSKMFADGGEVEKRYAVGGTTAGFTPLENPFKNGVPSYGGKDGKQQVGMSDVAGAFATPLLAEGASGAVKAGGKVAMDAIRAGLTQAPAPVVNAVAPTAVGGNAATVLNAGAVPGAEVAAGVATGAEAAAGVATGAEAASAIAAPAGALVPEVAAGAMAIPGWGWALAAGIALTQLLAEGGEVEAAPGIDAGRIDATGGGAVTGPGSPTGDQVRARVSPGEVVVNTTAVGMEKDDTRQIINKWAQRGGSTKALLLDINQQGLRRRQHVAQNGIGGRV